MANIGGASIGQPLSFFKGGRGGKSRNARGTKQGRGGTKQGRGGTKQGRGGTKRGRLQGGFYPSLMGGVLQNGPYLVTAAFAQGSRLVRGNRERMKARAKTQRSRPSKRRTAKA